MFFLFKGNRIIKEKHEICQNKFLQSDKENIELRKRLKERSNEIEKLKKKISELTSSSSSNNNNNKQEHSHQSNKSTDASSHKHKHSNIEKVKYLNTHNIYKAKRSLSLKYKKNIQYIPEREFSVYGTLQSQAE
jgi:predicted nuclease with TOPRIM domain